MVAIIEPVGNYGGMHHYNFSLTKALVECDQQVELYTNYYFKNDFIESKDYFSGVWEGPWFFKGIKLFLAYLLAIIDIKKRGIFIVHLHFFSLNIVNTAILQLLKLLRISTVITVHDIKSFHKGRFTFSHRILNSNNIQCIVHNKFSSTMLKKEGVSEDHINIVPHGNYSDSIRRLRNTKTSKNLNLLFFGQIKKSKGLDILLSALSKLNTMRSEWTLTIAGRPWKDTIQEYEEFIVKNKLDEKIERQYDYIKDEDVDVLFAKADLVILPYREIFQSGVLLLAMSYNKPSLVTNLPAFKDIIKDGYNGFLFDLNDIRSLTETLIRIIDDPLILNKICHNIPNYLEANHSWTSIGKLTKKVYEKFHLDSG